MVFGGGDGAVSVTAGQLWHAKEEFSPDIRITGVGEQFATARAVIPWRDDPTSTLLGWALRVPLEHFDTLYILGC